MSDPLISIELRAHIASLTAERDALLAAKERAEGAIRNLEDHGENA